ncbi:MAG: alanine dehydrogenase [Alphaproteobacteria bacterium]|nr:alanine dehydrogenase [Alphaproteobacteria bacterium]
MLIGVPKEIKANEHRVGLIPGSVREFIARGHKVIVEAHAGDGIGFFDDHYRNVGAEIVDTAAEVFERADMIIKVKEPQQIECAMLREDQILFTYLHLAADLPQTQGLQKSGCIAIAYETVTSRSGGLPLLAPMSEVAGRMSVQVGAQCLLKSEGGMGLLLGGVPGVAPADVTIVGGGVAGLNAMRMAFGLGATVTVIDRDLNRLRYLDELFAGRVNTCYSNMENIERYVLRSDLVIGTVLVPGAAAPKLITRDLIDRMRPGSAIVDVAVDQGGCAETTKPTTHAEPTYLIGEVIHYCVANMPGGVPRTSTMALNNATLPYALALADKGAWKAMSDDVHLRNGLNVCRGDVTYESVARDLNLTYISAETHVNNAMKVAA